jgi:hypothetical protein
MQAALATVTQASPSALAASSAAPIANQEAVTMNPEIVNANTPTTVVLARLKACAYW